MDKTQSASHLRVRDLGAGDDVRMLFLVSAASQMQARNGPFWRLELKDASASLEARIWNPLSQQYSDIPVGSLVEVEGRAESFREKLQINVTRLRVLTQEEYNEVELAAFLPSSSRSPQTMLNDLETLCHQELTHEPWHLFASGLLNDPDVRSRLLIAPAAKAVHHAWAGGLLEHTLSVTTLCLRFCDQYPELDRQTLFVGALCHDLGKLWELSGGLANDYTDEGRLIGHINLCLGKLEPYLAASGLSPELVLHLHHLILSHHGTYEFGSPRLPQTPEAFALHYADNIDAKLTQSRTLFADLKEGNWSPYQKTLERALYCAPRTPVASDGVRAHGITLPVAQVANLKESSCETLLPIDENSDDLPPPWERSEAEPPPWDTAEPLPLWDEALLDASEPETSCPPWDTAESEDVRSSQNAAVSDLPPPWEEAPVPVQEAAPPRKRSRKAKAKTAVELAEPSSEAESRSELRINQCSLL